MATPLFQPLASPILSALGSNAIRKFLLERERYEAAVEERRNQPGGEALVTTSLRASIAPELLWSLCDLQELGSQVDSPDKVTETHLSEWLNKHREIDKGLISISDLEKLVRDRVKMDTQEKDPEQRVIKLFSSYTSLLRRITLATLPRESPKVCVGHLVPLLRPPALRTRIENDLEFQHRALRKDFLGFYRHVLEAAKTCERFVTASAPSTTAPPSSNPPRSQLRGGSKSQTGTGPSNPAGQPPRKPPSNMPPKTGDSSQSSPSKFATRCLNSKCDKTHAVLSCQSTTAEHRSQLQKLYREKKQALLDSGTERGEAARRAATEVRKADESKSRTTGTDGNGESSVSDTAAPPKKGKTNAATAQPASDSALIPATLSEHLEGLAMADNGSDDNTISSKTVSQLQQSGVFVPTMVLAEPITMQLTSKDVTVEAKHKVQLTVVLKLNGGPLRLRNVQFLVLDTDFDEFILGRPLLKELGIDVVAQLDSARRQFHDGDFSQVPGILSGSIGSLSRIILSSFERDSSETLSHSEDMGKPQADFDLPDIPIGETREEEINSGIAAMLDRAKDNGISEAGLKFLEKITQEYRTVFAIKIGPKGPAKFKAMKLQLRRDAVPVRARSRPLSVEKRAFVRQETEALQKYGMIYSNSRSEWAHPVHVVPKPGPAKFRFTVDLRAGNARQKVVSWPMPHLESELQNLAGSVCYANFDLSQGYWQLPLDKDSQEMQSFITPDGVFTPTRVLHGNANSVAYLQSCLAEMTEDIRQRILIWLDDLLLHATSEEKLLNVLETFLGLCRDHNLHLHVNKSELFLSQVRYCGRIISKEGVRPDPRNLQGLLDMPPPVNGAQLQQFVCAMNWMRNSIPDFVSLLEPLQTLLETTYGAAGGRTKVKAAKVNLQSVGWSNLHLRSFESSKNALTHVATLAHHDDRQRICVFTDASQSRWGSIVTQVPPDDLTLPIGRQKHSPLAFLSGTFRNASLRWSIIDKEAYAIVATVCRLNYLLQTSAGYTLFTDHRNLVYIFDPLSSRPNLAAHSADRLQRWALVLNSSPYTIEHVAGSDNVWADMLSRWAAPSIAGKLNAVMMAPVSVPSDIEWPSLRAIHDSQRQHLSTTATETLGLGSPDAEGLYHVDGPEGPYWIPDEDTNLQLRLCIAAHCGSAGHRGHEPTQQSIQLFCRWGSFKDDVASFCNTCLHCLATTGGHRVPRPFGEALHASAPREVMHFDFLYIGAGANNEKYILVVKDDFSGYVSLTTSASATSASVVAALVDYFASFGITPVWVSDQGSHFKNEVMSEVGKALRCRHEFVVAHSPWANGTVEVVNREILRALRALLSELQLDFSAWPGLVPVVQSILNNSPTSRLNGRTPLTAFTGLPPSTPLTVLVPPSLPTSPVSLQDIDVARILRVDRLLEGLECMHAEILPKAKSARDRKRLQSTKHKNLPNFQVGDFVLVGILKGQTRSKLSLRWRGPRRIIACESPWVFLVEDLLSGATELVHVTRLKFFHDASLDITEDITNFVAHTQGGYEVSSLVDLRWSSEDLRHELLVRWRGFPDSEATWEPLPTLHEDIPDMVVAFLERHADQTFAQRALSTLH